MTLNVLTELRVHARSIKIALAATPRGREFLLFCMLFD